MTDSFDFESALNFADMVRTMDAITDTAIRLAFAFTHRDVIRSDSNYVITEKDLPIVLDNEAVAQIPGNMNAILEILVPDAGNLRTLFTSMLFQELNSRGIIQISEELIDSADSYIKKVDTLFNTDPESN